MRTLCGYDSDCEEDDRKDCVFALRKPKPDRIHCFSEQKPKLPSDIQFRIPENADCFHADRSTHGQKIFDEVWTAPMEESRRWRSRRRYRRADEVVANQVDEVFDAGLKIPWDRGRI